MGLTSRLLNVFRSNAVSADIDREMEFHIAERIDDLVAQGVPLEVAKREAHRQFGNYGALKEQTRERDLFAFLHTVIMDLRYAGRMLRSAPAFALVAVLSLGLGIGANTAIFTLVNAVLLRSLPVSRPEELMLVTRDGDALFTNPMWEAIRDQQDVFRGTAAYATTNFNLAESGEIRRVAAAYVSGDFFSLLGVRPALGRLVSRADDHRGCPAIAAIGAAFWQTNHGGSEGVIGQTLTLDGKPFIIVGVVDPSFSGPAVGLQTNVYVPLCAEAVVRGSSSWLDARAASFLQILARPKPGVSREQAQARLAALSPRIAQATVPPNWPAEMTDRHLRAKLGVEPAAGRLSHLRAYGKALWMLMGIVGVVLLIACANVANLLLARAAAREREMAVRLALGAGRGRLVRQLLTESLVLSLLGAAVGAVFARWGARLLVRMMSTSTAAVWLDLSVDIRVLVFTIAVAVATGILFGLAPIWRVRGVTPYSAMSRGRGITARGSQFGMGKALVTAQIALSVVLVVAAGLLLGSWRRLATIDLGFRGDGLLMVSVDLRDRGATPAQRAAAHRDLLERLRAMPNVVSASASDLAQVGSGVWNEEIAVDGFAPASDRDAVISVNEVADQYFATLGARIIAGRDFDAPDLPTSPRVAVVNEALARKFFAGASPIGRQFRMQDGGGYGPPITIVGLVNDMAYQSPRNEKQPTAFLAMSQNAARGPRSNFVVRAAGDPAAAIPSVRALLSRAAPRATLEFTTLNLRIADALRLPRTLAMLSGFFGGLALLLAAIGLYGIMSYSVARRRNEIGVRIALGAGRARVVRMVLGEMSRFVAVGIAAGVVLALAGAKLVESFLYGVTASDPTTLVASTAVLLVVAIGAALLPATRAASLDPVEALREE